MTFHATTFTLPPTRSFTLIPSGIWAISLGLLGGAIWGWSSQTNVWEGPTGWCDCLPNSTKGSILHLGHPEFCRAGKAQACELQSKENWRNSPSLKMPLQEVLLLWRFCPDRCSRGLRGHCLLPAVLQGRLCGCEAEPKGVYQQNAAIAAFDVCWDAWHLSR